MQQVNTFYTLKNNDILRHKYKEATSEKVFTVDHCLFPKVAFTQKGRIYLIGGSKNAAQTDLINSTYEVTLGPGNRSNLAQKANMKTARVGFGCMVDNYGERIFAIGGSTSKISATQECEVYDVAANRWTALPKLSEPKFS